MKILIAGFLIGALAGLLGALCGVGGGIVMVPAFLALGMAHKNAIATSLAIIVVTSLVATLNNVQRDALIDWRLVAIVSVFAAFAAWWGTDLMHQLKSPTLIKIFGTLLILIGLKMLVKP